MSTEKSDILRWLEEGKGEGASHMIVVCDTWDYDDFPVFVKPKEDVKKVVEQHSGKNMERVMEVYNLSMDWDTQINQTRSFNY